MQGKGKSLPVADAWFQDRVYIDNQHIVIYKNLKDLKAKGEIQIVL